MPRAPSSQPPAALNDRLEARRPELEQAALARIEAISDPAMTPDPAYVEGLRAALAAALDYGLAAIAAPGREPEPVPVQLLSQARLAARNGVSLDAVIRRYAAGHSLLADTLLDEAAAAGIAAAELKDALRALAARFDAVVAAVGDEYGREQEASPRDPEQRRAELLRRLLAGERLDASDLKYDFEVNHLGLVASGPGGAEALRKLGERIDRRLLLAEPGEQLAWAWLGGRREFSDRDLDFLASVDWPEQVAVGCGVSGPGLSGWRLSHRQAAAAAPIAQRLGCNFLPYPDVALLASVLHDDLLLSSLRQLYLDPLSEERDGGAAAKSTLRAYFCAAGNVSSAAAALGVNRATVRSRLSAIEERFGRPLEAASAEIEIALRLDQLEALSP
jgi:hypothetical protein